MAAGQGSSPLTSTSSLSRTDAVASGTVHEPLREDTSDPRLSRCPLPREALLRLGARDPAMRSYVAENRRKVRTRSGPPVGTVMRRPPDRHHGRQARVAAGLTDDLVREVPPEQGR